MRTSKRKQISDVIFQMMLENKINNEITNEITGQINDEYQNYKCFIYMEIINSKPQISYVFNTDEPIIIGRDLTNTAICIQDACVSRKHGNLFVQDDYLYIQNCSETQLIRVKRGLRSIWLQNNECTHLLKSDKVYLGDCIFKFYLFKGKNWIIN